MRNLDDAYPGYGLRQHFGYATRTHLAALVRLGPSPIHRRSFNPVRSWLSGELPPGRLPATWWSANLQRLRTRLSGCQP